MWIGDNKVPITTQKKVIHFDLLNNVGNNLNHEIDFIKTHNELLAKHTTKNEILQLLPKYKHGNDIHKNSKQ